MNRYRGNDSLDYASREFSITRAIQAQISGDWSQAGIEREVIQELVHHRGRPTNGILVPYEALTTRALSKGTGTAGGYTVGTNIQGDQFIEPLRNAAMVGNLGATILPGLTGDISIPKQSAAATASWVAESVDLTASDQTFAQVTLSPKTCGALTRLSRKLVLQSTPAIEGIVRADLLATVGVAIDLAALAGTGTGNQPTGILSAAGVGSVAGGTNGAAPVWSNVCDLQKSVEGANALLGNLAYLTNAKVKAKLLATQKAANLDFIWEDGTEPGYGRLAGYKAAVSNQVPSNLTKGTSAGVCSAIIFGNWSDLLIGMWGSIEVEVDPYTYFKSGDLQIRVMADVDVAIRNAQSFAVMLDALTT